MADLTRNCADAPFWPITFIPGLIERAAIEG